MVSFSFLDLLIIGGFFAVLMLIGLFAKSNESGTDYLLSGRKVGLWLFIFTNVSTWYGGILGVGEFTYRSGLLSWFTQGLPYYIFAILFAFFFAEKIRNASLITIPDKIEQTYGKRAAVISALLIFILVSPAPYILMIANIIQLVFKIDLLPALILSLLFSSIYLMKGGYKSDLYTDVFQFFVMFGGFIIIVVVSFLNIGSLDFLESHLPANHLKLTGGTSPLYIIVWCLIALWTFADPGFHQRCNSARDGKTAKYGILISVLFWMLFDFLTTTTGLFSKAVLHDLDNPVLAFPLYAEKILGSGLKGIFYAALFATIISTSNSFLFISATTFGRDLITKVTSNSNDRKLIKHTRIGIVVASLIALLISYNINSVISIWYLIGSICIPGIIFLIFGAYFNYLKVSPKFAIVEMIAGVSASLIWLIIQKFYPTEFVMTVEPMIIGLVASGIIHLIGIKKERT
ncbi:MAG: sodium:solute symporter family protein [Ignavibacteriales bacterium]|nr:sodium:solute symporter family protein [Ignavibacteriales bacterium]